LTNKIAIDVRWRRRTRQRNKQRIKKWEKWR